MLDLSPNIKYVRVVENDCPPKLPAKIARGTSRQTLVTPVVLGAEISNEVVDLAQHSGATLFSTLLAFWWMVVIESGWPVYRIGVPWSERPVEEMHCSIGNHIRMLVLPSALLSRSDAANDSRILPYEETLQKINLALRASAEELLDCTPDSAPDAGYDSVFAWDLEGGGWLQAASVASCNCKFLHIPQGAHPSLVSTLSLCYSHAGEVVGWLQNSYDQDQTLNAHAIVQEFVATCRRQARRCLI